MNQKEVEIADTESVEALSDNDQSINHYLGSELIIRTQAFRHD